MFFSCNSAKPKSDLFYGWQKLQKKLCVFNICAWSLFNKALYFCSLGAAEFVGNSFPPLLVIFWWSSRPYIYQALFHPWILQFSPRLFWTLMLIEKCCFRIDVKEKNLRQFGVILSIFKALQLIRRSVKFSMHVHLVSCPTTKKYCTAMC